MASRRISDGALMTLVLLVSLVLTLLPVDPLLRAIWPHWTAMVMIYWVLEGNRLRFFGQAWLLGLGYFYRDFIGATGAEFVTDVIFIVTL